MDPLSPIRALCSRLFSKIDTPADWADAIQAIAGRGPIVYVLRNLSAVDLLALDHLVRQHQLPALGFSNDVGLGPLDPTGPSVLQRLRGRQPERARLRQALDRGDSAVLYLKRPPHVRDMVTGASGGRGLKEGDALLQDLTDLQSSFSEPIQLVPLVFVWTNRPDTQGTRGIDVVFGPREWPSPIRALGQVLSNYENAELCTGQPLSLRQFLTEQQACEPETAQRRLVYLLLARLERERRSVTGPATIPPDLQRQRVLRSPQMQKVIRRMAGESPQNRAALAVRADDILKEMQATPNAAALRGARTFLDHLLQHLHSGLDVDRAGIARLRECAKEGTLVLLPSHKSHFDYMVLSYVFDRHHLGLPLIAAGDNLSFFPVGPIARRAGAFFIRRSFKGDRLYAATVEAYMRRLLRDGNTLEVYLEGGRSRTGKLLPPQIGLLNILVDAALSIDRRPVYFAPISIGYERLVEGQSFQDEVTGADKTQEDAAALLRSAGMLTNRYGRIDVQFGTPMTVLEIRNELKLPTSGPLPPAKRRAVVARLANRTMDEINRVTEVTPGSLAATAILSAPARGIPHEWLIARCRTLLAVLQHKQARIHPRLVMGSDLSEGAITEAVQLFADAGLIGIDHPERVLQRESAPLAGPDMMYSAVASKRPQLDTTKNHIVHFFVERGIAATAALMGPLPISIETGRQRVLELSQLFKHEFRFRPGQDGAQVFEEVLQVMQDSAELHVSGQQIELGKVPSQFGQEGPLQLYRAVLQTFVEGYVAAARSLALLLKGPMSDRDWMKKAAVTGNRMYLGGELTVPEAVCKPLFGNALKAFREEGYVLLKADQVALAPSCASEAAVEAVENRVRAYLPAGLR